MKRFTEFITELFNSPASLRWVDGGGGSIEAIFGSNDLDYFVSFSPVDERNAAYMLTFGIDDESIRRKFGAGRDPFAINAFGIVGVGNQFGVFSTVITAIRQFISKHKPNRIYFSAREPSRKKLYAHFVKLAGSSISGYTSRVLPSDDAYVYSLLGPGEQGYVIEKRGYKGPLHEHTSDIMGPAGDCFKNTNRWNAQKGEKTDFVCHGTVTNGVGKTFAHAWIESGDIVIDPTTGVRMPKSKYYKLLQVKNVKRYDSTTAIRNQIKYRQHGPWD